MEERDLNYFWKNCIKRGLCKEFVLLWRKCKTKKDLFDLSLRIQSIPYFATAIYEGWGVSIDYIKSEFIYFINGNYNAVNIEKTERYNNLTSALYCDYDEEKTIDTNVVHFCGCHCKINSPLNPSAIIFISNSSEIELTLYDHTCPIIYLFDDSKITIISDTKNCDVRIYKHSDNCIVEKENAIGKYLIGRKNIQL